MCVFLFNVFCLACFHAGPELFRASAGFEPGMECYACVGSQEFIWSEGGGEGFRIDDLLDFSCDDIGATIGGAGGSHGEKARLESAFSERNSGDSSVTETEAAATCDEVSRPTLNVVEADGSGGACPFSGELCVPDDALEELEWLSTFVVDDSLATVPEFVVPVESVATLRSPAEREESVRKQSNALLAGAGRTWVLGRARSKRSRNANPTAFVSVAIKNNEPRTGRKAAVKGLVRMAPPAAVKKRKKFHKKGGGCGGGGRVGQESRRCSHCLVQKTPQWRAGPLGPKTLCNACGVRFKSGRLLPEYRPALSPTFSSGLHSNCHRRVVEIRRQKIDQQLLPSQEETSSITDNSMAYNS